MVEPCIGAVFCERTEDLDINYGIFGIGCPFEKSCCLYLPPGTLADMLEKTS